MKISPGKDDALFKRISLIEQVADNLRESIRSGRWKKHLPSERALAESLNISRPILRQAIHCLRDEGSIRIVQGHPAEIIAHSTQYQAREDKRVILLFGHSLDTTSQWPLMVIDEIRKELYGQGFDFELIGDIRLQGRNPERLLQKLVSQYQANRWILAAVSVEVQQWFQTQNLNVAMMGNTFPQIKFPSVNEDLNGISRHAAGIFLGLGHKRMVFLMRNLGLAGEVNEEAGFTSAFRNASDASYSVVKHSGQVEQIHNRLDRMFSSPQKPTALLVSHAMDAIVVITWFLAKGIRIPADVSLISFQWESFLERVRPLPAWYYADPKAHARKLCRLITKPNSGKKLRLIIPEFFKNGAIAKPPPEPVLTRLRGLEAKNSYFWSRFGLGPAILQG